MRFPKISSEKKQTLLGATVSALAVDLEAGMSWFVPAYPQIFKDKLTPWLPRNGSLIANIAPAGIAWAVTRKGRGSARANNIKMGTFLYDFPRLLDNVLYNVAYQAGLPASTVGLRSAIRIAPITVAPPPIMAAPQMMGGGSTKYAVSPMSASMGTTSGMGKYKSA